MKDFDLKWADMKIKIDFWMFLWVKKFIKNWKLVLGQGVEEEAKIWKLALFSGKMCSMFTASDKCSGNYFIFSKSTVSKEIKQVFIILLPLLPLALGPIFNFWLIF